MLSLRFAPESSLMKSFFHSEMIKKQKFLKGQNYLKPVVKLLNSHPSPEGIMQFLHNQFFFLFRGKLVLFEVKLEDGSFKRTRFWLTLTKRLREPSTTEGLLWFYGELKGNLRVETCQESDVVG